MIAGTLNGRLEAVIPLTVFGPNGDSEVVEALVDTGFTGRLILPAAVVTKLGLVRQTGTVMRLADGVSRSFDSYEAEVEWGGTRRPVLASTVGDEALIGMRLLEGHRLTIDVIDGGPVSITVI